VENQIERCSAFINQCDEKSKNIPCFTEEQIMQALPKLKEFVKSSEREEVRSMIQRYVDRVTVYNDRVEVTYKVAFSLAQNQSINYTYARSISRYNLNKFGKKRLFNEYSQNFLNDLYTA